MLTCEVRTVNQKSTEYVNAQSENILFEVNEVKRNNISKTYKVMLTNNGKENFTGVIHIKLSEMLNNPKFFMPGYMYNRNTADMPNSGRKAFPRIKFNPEKMPESEFFMTRSDRLSEPVSIVYSDGQVLGISASPVILDENGSFVQFAGFSCNINDNGKVSVGYTLGYENAPWFFLQTANVYDREDITPANSFILKAGSSFSFELLVYNYEAEDERGIHAAIKEVYERYHEAPRKLEGMDSLKALRMLSGAIRDYAWIKDRNQYTGFVYDRPNGFEYNYIPSITWTNGLAVAVPMLLTAEKLQDEKAREQSLCFIDDVVFNYFNPKSGFLYESYVNQKPSVRGWWYDGMHSGGHSSYLNGQAVYYILTAYNCEKKNRKIEHSDWLSLAQKVVTRMNEVINGDYEYPFSMSEKTGVGLEYDSMGSVWCLAASALYLQLAGKNDLLEVLLNSEKHYYDSFVKVVECYGGPLDTDKAVDSEGILGYIRAVRILHELTGKDYLLDHLRDALYYEFTFKLGYNTHIEVRPLSEIGWSSSGGSITSTANPHIHPMSSTVISEMDYYLGIREDEYIRQRRDDTFGWGLQTFNTRDGEYGYGKEGWMSERFCFCRGLLTEHYPDGEVASTWFALMPWASGSIIEGFVR